MTDNHLTLSVGKISRELVEILISYLKTYVVAAAVFTVFFVFYAGIKTDRISIEFVASIFAAVVVSTLLWIGFVFLKAEIGSPASKVIDALREKLRGERKAIEARAVRTDEIIELVRIVHTVSSRTVFIVVRMLVKEYVLGVSTFRQMEDSTEEVKESTSEQPLLLLPPDSPKTRNHTNILTK